MATIKGEVTNVLYTLMNETILCGAISRFWQAGWSQLKADPKRKYARVEISFLA